ncbi:MAG TPA: sorbosone dehydrogenase family protein [Thermoanaerobaculia bacterium]|jgi:glucose/arabinose dehydrogenase|nr:sorbosone dehydrogenase family protein [Thermoanaerobaculia bacterium]
MKRRSGSILAIAIVAGGILFAEGPRRSGGVLTGQGALGDWTTDSPGVRRKITAADLPPPFETKSVNNQPRVVKRPDGAMPKVPAGFQVEEFLGGLDNPRLIRTAPNGDVFLAESYPGRIRVLRFAEGASKPAVNEVFASGLDHPFGIAFYPPGPDPKSVYVGETGAVVRFAYRSGDLKAGGKKEVIVPDIPSGAGRLGGGGHWTRDLAFSPDGKKLFVSVGSRSNVQENPSTSEDRRACILEYNPDGTGMRLYASGIRNAVGIAVHPKTGELWASVNERDGLGDDLVPDYVTRVKDGGFYGWPWFYLGTTQDPRHPGAHPELRGKVIVPDVLIQSHSASLEMVFYTGSQFPSDYSGDAFAAQHGSWNREKRTGYKVIRVPVKDGVPTGEYEDFLTGFVTPDGNVWGRPVGVAVAKDGSLLVTDDGGDRIWRISAVRAR